MSTSGARRPPRWSVIDHNNQQMTKQERIRAQIYPLLASICSISLFSIACLLIPQAVKTHRYNRCVDVQVTLRVAINPTGLTTPGRMNYLKAVEHCEGY